MDASLSKSDRLKLTFQVIQSSPLAATIDEALQQITTSLNAIEDAFSGVSYNPNQAGTDGRMYPPDEMWRYVIWERVGIRCYRQAGHATFIAENGAIEVRIRVRDKLGTEPTFEKPGANGKKVSDYG